LPLLPGSYVKLALCLVLQWTAMAKAVSPPNGDVIADEDLGQWLHTIVALNAAVVQAWPAAAAAARHAGSSSTAAEVAMYTLAAQRAVTFTSETLVPMVVDAEMSSLAETQAAAVDLVLSDDVLLLLLMHVALLSRQVAAQQQQQQQSSIKAQQQCPEQSTAQQPQQQPHEQLLQAVGLSGLLVQAADATHKQQQQPGPSTACSADDIYNAVAALRQVFVLRVMKRKKQLGGKLGELLAAHKPQQCPAVRIDLAAVWQPLLQVVLQLPLTEAAAGVSEAGEREKQGYLRYTLQNAVDLACNMFEALPAHVYEAPPQPLDGSSARIPLIWGHIGRTLTCSALGQLAPLVLQQFKQSAPETRRSSAAHAAGSAGSSSAGGGGASSSSSSSSSSNGGSRGSRSNDFLSDAWARLVNFVIEAGK
jgi:hypothetical protein